MLGISHKRLIEIKQSDTFLGEMIYFWLTRVDNVLSEGIPTWETLAKALNHSTIRQTGLAEKILSNVQNSSRESEVGKSIILNLM